MALKETIQEFKEFAIKGNVVDMAVGVIIGGAFGKIVTSFVNDLIMPIIGKLTGGADFSQLYLPLDGNHYATLADAQAATATIAYGSFLTQVLDFLIVAIVIFAALKVLVKLKRPAAPVEEAPEAEAAPVQAPAGDDTPNANPVELGAVEVPKTEDGKLDVTKIADPADFGDWDEQGFKG